MSSNVQTSPSNVDPSARALHGAAQQHSSHARKVVFVKGIFDIFLAISVMFFPTFAYNGPVGSLVAKMTGLRNPDWAAEADSAFAIASLIMGAAVAAITAGQSESNCAYRTVAALNGTFALTGLITCFFSPHRYGSTFLLLASLQDVFWYTAIVRAGGFGFADCLGLSSRGLYMIEESLSRTAMKALGGVKEEPRILEERGKEMFGGTQGMYSDAVGRDAKTDSQRSTATGIETRDDVAREHGMKQGQHKKGLGQDTPTPASVN